MGVGYIIGPQLASLNFAGGLLAWGLFVPLLLFFLGPSMDVNSAAEARLFDNALNEHLKAAELAKGNVLDSTSVAELAAAIQAKRSRDERIAALAALTAPTTEETKELEEKSKQAAEDPYTPAEAAIHQKVRDATTALVEAAKADAESEAAGKLEKERSKAWAKASVDDIWKGIVRKIAIGGMLLSAAFTLFRMRKSLASGLSRAVGDVRKAAAGASHAVPRTDKDLNFTTVLFGLAIAALATFAVYYYFAGDLKAAIVATAVMIVAGFFFSAVSGNLVGLIGSSNNPISGLTISTLLIAALLMVALGVTGTQGVAAVLGVAAVICVAAAVAGEMLQDLKVGHILGGTPWKMQLGDMVGVVLASAVMFFPILILHEGDKVGGGLGGTVYSAPQASLMATLAKGIVDGDMAWPLVIVGALMAFGLILVKVKSPMLVCVGMYLPLETSFAIFIGGMIKGILEKFAARRKLNEAQKIRSENNGVLLASGLIAGEALVGLLFAGLAVLNVHYADLLPDRVGWLPLPFSVSLLVFALVALVLIRTPLRNAGSPDEPAPPSAMM
ncbi:MAG TPA: oligopeptide transporter, OPT family [Planctomycetes bacterium]|nr:oligopeptide transporter, OPT family [Planctomycetota bacterium]